MYRLRLYNTTLYLNYSSWWLYKLSEHTINIAYGVYTLTGENTNQYNYDTSSYWYEENNGEGVYPVLLANKLPEYVTKGSTFTDTGATTAGFVTDPNGLFRTLKSYKNNKTKAVSETLDTSRVGTYTATYTLQILNSVTGDYETVYLSDGTTPETVTRTIEVIPEAPYVTKISLVSPTSGEYGKGTQITFAIKWNQNAMVAIAPELKLKFGENGAERDATYVSTIGNVSTYTYIIADGDIGRLELVSYGAGYVNDNFARDWVSSEITFNDIIAAKPEEILMSRENVDYVIGYSRIANGTSYTSDKIKTITIQETETPPTGYIVSGDVSAKNDGGVIAWLAPNGSMYDLYIGSFGDIIASSGTNLFANYTNCTSITGLENLNTSSVESMENMFADCSSLTSLEVEKIDSSNCSSMAGMFKNCNKFTSLNLGKLKTIRVTNMSEMFADCVGLTSLDVKDFRTVNVTDMSAMFKNCSALTSLDVSGFNTSRVTNFASMFSGCSGLTSIRLENFTTAKANSVEAMFDSCTNLETLVLGKNFSKIDGTNMFRNCTSLKRIIAKSENAMTLSTDAGINALANAKIYVEKKGNLSKYTSATNYGTLYEAGKVRAMLEIIGDNPASATFGATYEDEGATVAGWAESEKAEYEKLGYTLTTTGLPVNTNQVGKHHVIYTLKYSAQTIDTATN